MIIFGPLQPNARRWLLAACFIGAGQQIFVVMRNQYLLARGMSPLSIGSIQAAGGVAGILAGVAGLASAGRLSDRMALALGIVANGLGFAVQAFARTEMEFMLGSSLAGFGIQFITMTATPFLVRNSTIADRVRLLGLGAAAVQTLPGAVGALIGGELHGAVAAASGSGTVAFRAALGLGVIAVIVALAPVSRLDATPQAPPTRASTLGLRKPMRDLALLVPDAFLYLGMGLSVPFLQLYFRTSFGLEPRSIGVLYAGMMTAGIAGQLFAPTLVSRFVNWRVLLVTQILTVPLFAVLIATRSLAVAATAFVLRFALACVGAPLYASFLHSSVSPADSDRVAAIRMLGQSMVWAAANLAAGLLMTLDRGGFRYVIASSTVAYMLAIISGAFLYPRVRT